MKEDLNDCPYCESSVKDLEEHLELKHEELTLNRFILNSKYTIVTGFMLLLSLFTLLINMEFNVFYVSLQRAFMLIGVLIGGYPLAKESITKLLEERRFHVDGLVVIASIGALIIGYWGEAIVLIFLFSSRKIRRIHGF